MASRKGIEISRHHVVLISAMHFRICILNSKKMKIEQNRTLYSFLKLNDHQTRYFNFGLRRIHPSGCKSELS